jgi:hypothetical protein
MFSSRFDARRSHSPGRRWIPLAAAALALVAAACRPEPPPQGEEIESGGWDFYLNNEKIGSETYVLRRTGRQLQCTVRSELPGALASASVRMRLSASYRPLEFDLEAQRSPLGRMEIHVEIKPGRARVRMARGELVREDMVEISARARLLEEGLVTLAQMALQGLDLRQRERLELPVLLPQLFSQAQVLVENLGLEKIAVGDEPPRPLRHVRFSLAGGASDYWLDDERRIRRYVSQVPGGVLEARRQREAERKRSSAARPPAGIDSPSPSNSAS